ncbi:ACP S-malonyltransferase [Thiohalospira sp.]|uniref:ACP S-malonyltransferase n=1 Tax=Thiohalospira sp. TaxID=3080549 RepID=UPI00397FEA89
MAIAFVFPGQGSQSVGMLADLAESAPEVRATFDEASTALGEDLWQLVQEGPEETLNRTDRTQPAMLAAGVAVWRAWQARGGGRPVAMAGHSLGEYTALVCAGSLAFDEAVRLVADRGRFMQEAVPAGEGAMAAILGLDDETVMDLCEQAAQGNVVQAVNFNAPGQVVIAGDTAAVERAVAAAKEAGAKRAVTLPVSVPSHCSRMHPAAERLAQRLEGVALEAPDVPVIHNVDAAPANDPAAIREALVRQVENPVRWVASVQRMAADGATDFIEAGPGKVLAGLIKRIDRNVCPWAVADAAGLEAALQAEEDNA